MRMKYITFDESRPFDLILLGRVAIDFNPAYNDQVKEEFKPLKNVHMFEKFVGGSPANIAVGVTRHGMKAGFLGKVSDDQFGDYVVDYFNEQGIDTSHITRCTNGEKLGLTFTEMLSPSESSILMYRNCIADLQLSVDDIDEEYIRSAKAILISGTSLAESPSREAAIKAVMLAKRNDTKVIFDIDYRAYNWKNEDEISIYYSIVAKEADIIMGSRPDREADPSGHDGRGVRGLLAGISRENRGDQARHERIHRLHLRRGEVLHQTVPGAGQKGLRRRRRLWFRFPVRTVSGLGYHRLPGVRLRGGVHDGEKQQLFRFPSGTGGGSRIY